jgi:hypothetical protein
MEYVTHMLLTGFVCYWRAFQNKAILWAHSTHKLQASISLLCSRTNVIRDI